MRETETEREREKKDTCSEPRPKAHLVFPVVGKVRLWEFTEEHRRGLANAFPTMDVLAEARKAKVWCDSNPKRRKTPDGMERFLFSWMDREQNRPKLNGNHSTAITTEAHIEEKLKTKVIVTRRLYADEIAKTLPKGDERIYGVREALERAETLTQLDEVRSEWLPAS